MTTIKINGMPVHAHGDKKKPCIIFLHGFPYDNTMWDQVIPELTSDFFCVSYDLRGLGQSDPGDGLYTIESFVDDLENMSQEMNLDKPILCGFSMGGYIVLRAAERSQEKWAGLILVNTKSASDPDPGRIKRAQLIKQINTQGLEAFCDSFVPNCFSDATKHAEKDFYMNTLKQAKQSSPLGVKGCLLAMAARTDTTPFLSQINIPALVVSGQKDALIPESEMANMAQQIPGARYSKSPHAAHMVPLEDPQILIQGINETFGT